MVLLHAYVETASPLAPDTAFGGAEAVDLLAVLTAVHFMNINIVCGVIEL